LLGLEVLRAVLADDLDPGFRERAHVVRGDVLRGRDDRDPGPKLAVDPLVVRADGLNQ
jgi:hypothetical protein